MMVVEKVDVEDHSVFEFFSASFVFVSHIQGGLMRFHADCVRSGHGLDRQTLECLIGASRPPGKRLRVRCQEAQQ